MPEEPYRVSLDNIFEGPMDLLVYLIKKNELNIYDIPIALITQQYLDALNMMQSLNLSIAVGIGLYQSMKGTIHG